MNHDAVRRLISTVITGLCAVAVLIALMPLVLVPVMYSLVDDATAWIRRHYLAEIPEAVPAAVGSPAFVPMPPRIPERGVAQTGD